jgi:hypothetical protein
MSLNIIVYLKTKSGLYTLPWTVSSTDITKVLDDTQTKLLDTIRYNIFGIVYNEGY